MQFKNILLVLPALVASIFAVPMLLPQSCIRGEEGVACAHQSYARGTEIEATPDTAHQSHARAVETEATLTPPTRATLVILKSKPHLIPPTRAMLVLSKSMRHQTQPTSHMLEGLEGNCRHPTWGSWECSFWFIYIDLRRRGGMRGLVSYCS
jgi:hypothetical protein